jgi:hypothetical protein
LLKDFQGIPISNLSPLLPETGVLEKCPPKEAISE